MTVNQDAQKLIDEAVAILKTTTVGYAGHSAAWRANQTTSWWKGLDKLAHARKALDPIPAPTPPPVSSLPTRGISVGGKSLSHPFSSREAVELDLCKDIGAQFVRCDIYPGNEQTFKAYEAQARARGLEVLACLYNTTPLKDPATVEAYARAQGTAFPTVRLWEFANEPDLQPTWTPESYAASAAGFCRGLRAVRSDATLIVGALWKWKDDGASTTDAWVKRMIAAGFPDCDLLSLHLYNSPAWNDPHNIWNMAFGPLPTGRTPIRQQLDAAGLSRIRLCSTENGDQPQDAATINADFDAVKDGRLAFHTVYSMLDDDVAGFGLVNTSYVKSAAYAAYKERATA